MSFMSPSTTNEIVQAESVSVPQSATIADAIAAVRAFTPTDDEGGLYYVYVTDDEKLVGVVSLRELLNADDTDTVANVMTTDVTRLSTANSLNVAMQRIIDSGFPVLPVVDDSETFVGVIRANSLIDALDEQTTKQLFKQAGLWMR